MNYPIKYLVLAFIIILLKIIFYMIVPNSERCEIKQPSTYLEINDQDSFITINENVTHNQKNNSSKHEVFNHDLLKSNKTRQFEQSNPHNLAVERFEESNADSTSRTVVGEINKPKLTSGEFLTKEEIDLQNNEIINGLTGELGDEYTDMEIGDLQNYEEIKQSETVTERKTQDVESVTNKEIDTREFQIESISIKIRESHCGKIFMPSEDIIRDPKTNVYLGEFPWMLQLYHDYYGEKRFVCGASLITASIVMTAAHCMKDNYSNYYVRAGSITRVDANDSFFQNPKYPYQDRKVSIGMDHINYKSSTLDNNIAMLKLEEPFHFAPHINTICLPSNLEEYYDEEKCISVGYAKLSSEFDMEAGKDLRKIGVSLISQKSCENSLKTYLGPLYNLHKRNTCAMNQTMDIHFCKGDGGSPLICPLEDKPATYVQVGISGWHVQCSRENIPSIYSFVEKFLDFILNFVKNNDDQFKTQKKR